MKIPSSALKSFRNFIVMAITILLIGSFSAYGQENKQSDQEINSASFGANQVHDYAGKALQTENFVEAKLYMQNALTAAKQTKTVIVNAEKLLIEQEKQISNSANKELIENIKDEREEMTEAVEYAITTYDFIEKACQTNDMEVLHMYVWEIFKASKKILRQTEAAQHYSSLIIDMKTN